MQPYLDEALKLYNELDYEQALQQLAQGRSVSAAADDVSLSLYEGLILAELGRADAANEAFSAALKLQPDAELPFLVSPKVQQRFEEARQQVKRQLSEMAAPEMAPQPRVVVPPLHPPSSLPFAHVVSPAEEEQPPSFRRVWLPATIGGGLLVGGGVAYMLARGEEAKLKGSGTDFATPEDVKRTTSRGRT
ncbi:hypothetical protein D7V88_41265, partial [Corallococcus terminator]